MRTLRSLPAGAVLALSHPELPEARLHSGVVLPVDEYAAEVAAEFFDIAYWVVAASPGPEDDYFDLVVQSWNRFGWPIRIDRDSRPRAAYTRTPDQVGLSVRESVDGFVSLAGSTVPFAVGLSAGPPFPDAIEHPLTAPQEPVTETPGRSEDIPSGGADPQ